MYVCLSNKSEYIDFILMSRLSFDQLTDAILLCRMCANNLYVVSK